jgi:cyclohexanecarboxylate-CoA ligase
VPHRFRNVDHLDLARSAAGAAGADAPLLVVVRPEERPPGGAVSFDDLLDEQREAEPVGEPTDITLLLYTSGTTADPKGVLHSHQTLGYEVRSFVEMFSLSAEDTVFMPSPVTHITGLLFGLLLPVVTGSAAVLLDVWDSATAVDLVEAKRCRFIMGATPFLAGMTAEHARRGHGSALRTFLCGGADVPPELIRRATEVMNCHVARVYGSSEMPTLCCGGPNDDLRLRAETDGAPISPARARLDAVVDGVGELVVDGPERFWGYLDPVLNAPAFTADGWFRTGDLASIDGDGAVTIRGRSKDIIVRGGENISAKEIEELLYGHPAVEDAAVIAMPDPVLAERVCAFVVPTAGVEPTLPELTSFLGAQRLASQKLPERLEIVETLPMTASGKVQKHILRQRLRTLLEAEATGAPVASPHRRCEESGSP